MSLEVQQHVTVRLPDGELLPAAIEAIDEAGLTLVVLVAPPVPLDTLGQCQTFVEWTTRRGVHRLSCAIDEATRPGLLRVRRLAEGDVVQRRDWFRVEAFVPVTLVTREAPPRTVETTTVDVSGGGLRVSDPVRLPAGTELEIALQIRLGDPVLASGRVVRQTGDGQTGIRIDEIGREDRQALVRFVTERERAALRIARQR